MGRLRGCLWLTAGLVVALVAAVVGYMAISRAAANRSGGGVDTAQVDVVVAAAAVPVRTVLTDDMVRVQRMAVSTAPEGALQQTSQAIGKVTTVELYPGEPLLIQRLVDPNVTPANGRNAVLLDGDKVLMAFPADDLMSKVGVLRPGDHVDLLATLDFPAAAGPRRRRGSKQPATFNVLQNLTIAATVSLPSGAAARGGRQQRAARAAPDGQPAGRADAEIRQGCGRQDRHRGPRPRRGRPVPSPSRWTGTT